MAQYGYFAHDDPAPPVARTAFQRACSTAATPSNAAWGENIAFGQSTPTERDGGLDRLAAATGRTSTDPSFRAIGVGVAADAVGRIYWVQDFGSVVPLGRHDAAARRPRRRRRRRPRRPPPPAPPAPPAASPPPSAPATPPAPVARARRPRRRAADSERRDARPCPQPRTPQIGGAIAPQSATGRPSARTRRAARASPSPSRTPASPTACACHSAACPSRPSALARALPRAPRGQARSRATATSPATSRPAPGRFPPSAGGERLVVRVKVSGRHGVSLVRSARLIVGA